MAWHTDSSQKYLPIPPVGITRGDVYTHYDTLRGKGTFGTEMYKKRKNVNVIFK